MGRQCRSPARLCLGEVGLKAVVGPRAGAGERREQQHARGRLGAERRGRGAGGQARRGGVADRAERDHDQAVRAVGGARGDRREGGFQEFVGGRQRARGFRRAGRAGRAFGARGLDDRVERLRGSACEQAGLAREGAALERGPAAQQRAGGDELGVDVGGGGRLRERLREGAAGERDQPHARDGRERGLRAALRSALGRRLGGARRWSRCRRGARRCLRRLRGWRSTRLHSRMRRPASAGA